MSEQGFGIVCVEIKNNHVKSWAWRGELELAGKSVTEFFKFSLYEFVSCFSVSELQWCATSETGFRLVQPTVGFLFVAKNKLGLVLNQLDVIHFLVLGRLTGVRSVSVGGRRRCWGLGAIFSKHLDAARDISHRLNHVPVRDE